MFKYWGLPVMCLFSYPCLLCIIIIICSHPLGSSSLWPVEVVASVCPPAIPGTHTPFPYLSLHCIALQCTVTPFPCTTLHCIAHTLPYLSLHCSAVHSLMRNAHNQNRPILHNASSAKTNALWSTVPSSLTPCTRSVCNFVVWSA